MEGITWLKKKVFLGIGRILENEKKIKVILWMVTHKIVNGNYRIVNGNYKIVNGKIVNGTARPPKIL